MATKKKPTRKRAKKSDPLASAPPPDQLTPPQEEVRRATVTQAAELRRQDERLRRDDLRFNMLRSVITEPLLSKVQEHQADCYDVIISLNEFYKGGIAEALADCQDARGAVERSLEQRLELRVCLRHRRAAADAGPRDAATDRGSRQRGEDPRTAPVIYRIWEDNDVHISLTRSLTTVKADAAQRAFQARGEGIVWAVLDSGIQGDHAHFKREDSPFGPIDTLAIRPPVSTSISHPTAATVARGLRGPRAARCVRARHARRRHHRRLLESGRTRRRPGRGRRDAQRAGQQEAAATHRAFAGDQRRGPQVPAGEPQGHR